ncbi:IS4 family transposase [Pseudarthrobacter sp. H2]|uniref:IS4 family transposase n=1 Tax=Pseudarthrobacter sp. H2 TaxID=3418415 RepID=UPI003CF09958
MARSGWVTPEGPERLSDHVSLGVLTRVFPPDVVDAVIGRTGAREQRNRLLPSRLMVYYVMALALFSAGSYEEVMRSLLAGMEWITGRFRDWQMPTKAAIFKARTRLGSAVMAELFAETAKPLALPGGPGFHGSWRLVSVDGTCLDLADTEANERAYGRPGTATDLKSAYPQARVLGLVECATHAVIGAVVSGFSTSEHDLYPGLLHRLEADMLAMADRGFFSYTAWKDSSGTGAQLLWRVKANAVLPVLEDLADGSYLSAVYANPKTRRNNTDPIRVRVIEYTVSTGDTSSEFRLITTILDPHAASAEDLAEAYAKRWEIESCFDELKTHQRGPGTVLRSKTPDGVLQEIYGYLCVHYAIRSLIGDVAHHFEEDPLRFSFTRTLRAVRRSLAARPAFSP